jgi:hypothetical protein
MIQETESTNHCNQDIKRNLRAEEENILQTVTAAHRDHLHQAHQALTQVLDPAQTDPVKSKSNHFCYIEKRITKRKMINDSI